ncbi:carboxypeptidase regulatory-like domain-containing protein, partial [Porphyromonas sp.]
MRHLTKLVLLIIPLALTACLNARLNAQEPFTQEVRGEVISALPDDTIVGASIILVGSDPLVGTTTGSDQKFSLRLPVGRCSLQISCVGYESQEVDLLVVAGKQSVLHIA